jgi:methyl-accepting chemotaxis protein
MTFTGSIRNKIWLCVLVTLCGYLVATLSSYLYNSNLAKELTHIREVPFPLSMKGQSLLTTFKHQNGLYENSFLMAEEEPTLKANSLNKEILSLFNQIDELAYRNHEDYSPFLAKLRAEYIRYYNLASITYVAAAKSSDINPLQKNIQSLGIMQSQLLTGFETLVDNLVKNVENHVEEAKTDARQITYFLVGLFLIVLILVAFIINIVSQKLLIQPLANIQDMVLQFATGSEIEKPASTDKKDEIGVLADSFYNLTKVL